MALAVGQYTITDLNDGRGIQSIVNYYQLTSTQTTPATTDITKWSTNPLSTTTTLKYLWNFERITYVNPAGVSDTTPAIISTHGATGATGATGPQGPKGDTGATGATGAAGQSFAGATDYYKITNSATVPAIDSSWTTTAPQTTVANKFLWKYEVVHYTNPVKDVNTTPIIISVHAVGVASTVHKFQKSSSSTTAPTTWLDTPPTLDSTNKYLWSYVITNFTEGSPLTTTPSVIGSLGTNGAATYTWIQYADDINGSGMSTSPNGKRYVGFSAGHTSITPAGVAGDYTWSPLYDNVQVGGVNLAKNTSRDWRTLDLTSSMYYFQDGLGYQVEVGETYTFSVIVEKVSADTVPINLWLGLGQGNAYLWDFPTWRLNAIPFGQKVSLTYTVKDTDGGANGYKYLTWRLRNELQATTIRFKEVKLEKGNIATDWSPAPEDVQVQIDAKEDMLIKQSTTPTGTIMNGQLWLDTSIVPNVLKRYDGSKWVAAGMSLTDISIGGTNFLLNSDVTKTDKTYPLNAYPLASPIEAGKTYTVTLHGTLGTGKSSWGIYNSGDSFQETSLTSTYKIGTNLWSRTFVAPAGTRGNVSISVFPMPSLTTEVDSTIDWIKLEEGNIATDWSAAPADFVTNQAQSVWDGLVDTIRSYSDAITAMSLSVVKHDDATIRDTYNGVKAAHTTILERLAPYEGTNAGVPSAKANIVSAYTDFTASVDTVLSDNVVAEEEWVTLRIAIESYRLAAAVIESVLTRTTYFELGDVTVGNVDIDQKLTSKGYMETIAMSAEFQSALLGEENSDQTFGDYLNIIKNYSEFRNDFNTWQKDVNGINQQITNSFTFNQDGSFEIGATIDNVASPFKMKLTSSELSFLLDGTKVAYISNQKLFITDAEVTGTLKIGNHTVKEYGTNLTIFVL